MAQGKRNCCVRRRVALVRTQLNIVCPITIHTYPLDDVVRAPKLLQRLPERQVKRTLRQKFCGVCAPLITQYVDGHKWESMSVSRIISTQRSGRPGFSGYDPESEHCTDESKLLFRRAIYPIRIRTLVIGPHEATILSDLTVVVCD